MTLIDANALVNLVDKAQPKSALFRATFNSLRRPTITTWPAFTEAMYLVFGIGGWPMERKLWDYILLNLVRFHFPVVAEEQRIVELMERYAVGRRPARRVVHGPAKTAHLICTDDPDKKFDKKDKNSQ